MSGTKIYPADEVDIARMREEMEKVGYEFTAEGTILRHPPEADPWEDPRLLDEDEPIEEGEPWK